MNQPIQTTNLEHLLGDLDGGVFAQKIATALSDAALAVAHTGKTGSVTVTFAMKRIGDSSQVQVDHKLAYSKPTAKGKVTEENTTSTPLYVGARGALTLIPDTQQRLFAERGAGAEE